MIQFRRGTTKSWKDTKTKLASGQPGYDKEKHKLKIGDGKSSWEELPYVSGLDVEDILDSEENAKAKYKKDKSDITLITYGTKSPDDTTVGQIYFQYGTADHVTETGIIDGWIYQIYSSGVMKCYGTFKVKLDIIDNIEGTGLYCDSSNFTKKYPKPFKSLPLETVSVQSSSGLAWLANKKTNTTATSGTYTVVSPATANNIEYTISIQVVGIKQ
jgi:hypothetical protein